MAFTYIPRVLAVGELNPYGMQPEMALYPRPRGAAGDRLRHVFGLTDVDYLKFVARANLCYRRWSVSEARLRATTLLCSDGPRVVVLLGARVREAAGGPSFFESRTWRHPTGLAERQVVSLPHPSGRCRAWNEEGAVGRARDLLRGLVPDVPWGSLQ